MCLAAALLGGTACYLYWPMKKPPPRAAPPKVVEMDLKTLRQFDGNEGRRGYLCVNGDIFDVTGVGYYA
jgi:hypothetical protein